MRTRLGTRGSPLALWQAERVRERLIATAPDIDVEIVVIRTRAERFPDEPLQQIGTGVFSKELDDALLRGDIDLAVHSLKDLPSDCPPGLVIAAVPERETPFDAFVSADGTHFEALPAGARIGTGSPRRQAQLLAARPDVEVLPLRGNVQTRLRKIRDEGLAGTVLAQAGLIRLGMEDFITHPFSPDVLLPAVAQGALAVVVREDDDTTRVGVEMIDDGPSHVLVAAERAFLRELRGGCQVPAGALATSQDNELRVDAVLASPDGTTVLRTSRSGSPSDGETIGQAAAAELLARGGDEILRQLERTTDGDATT